MRPSIIVLCTALLSASVAAPTHAADPSAPLATLAGTCAPGDGPTVLTAARPDPDRQAILRTAVSGGALLVDEQDVGDGEVRWHPAGGFGGSYHVTVDCRLATEPASFSFEFHGVPALPTTLAGVGAGSAIPFTVDRPAAVVGELEVSGGSVVLVDRDGREHAGNGTIALGAVPAGQSQIGVRPSSTGVRWSLRLRAAPATLSGLQLDTAIPAGSVGARGQFTLDQPSRVQVTVHDKRGDAVDWPLTPTDLAAGTYPFGWDGRTLPGDLAADGQYEVRVRSTDAAGTTSQVTGPVLVDRAGPLLSFGRVTVGLHQDVRLSASDEPAGIASLSATVAAMGPHPARTVGVPAGERRLVLSPPAGGWQVGRHALVVTATDRAGNRTKRTLTLSVFEVMGQPCGRPRASSDVLGSSRVMAALAATREGRGRPIAKVFRVSRVLCVDLDGDRVREMVVLLRGRRAGAPTPLVAFRVSDRGLYAPRVISTRHVIRGLAVRGRTVRGTVAGRRALTVRADARGTPVLRVSR